MPRLASAFTVAVALLALPAHATPIVCAGSLPTGFGPVGIQFTANDRRQVVGLIGDTAVTGALTHLEEFTRWSMNLSGEQHECLLNDWAEMNKAHCAIKNGPRSGTEYVVRCRL